MQLSERYVLTVEEPRLVRKALHMLSAGVESEGGDALGTLKRFEEFAKEGCGRLILNLRVIEDPVGETPQEIRNVRASLVGGVLVVTCEVPSQEILRIKVLTRHHPFPRHLIAGFGVFFSSVAGGLETAAEYVASPARRVKASPRRTVAR